jgi:dTDP-4-dehydrorhamnose 3,5-epimerase
MLFQPMDIPDVVQIHPQVFEDARGFFFEVWEERKFAAAGLSDRFVQDNHSRSVQNTLRGLHYQVKQSQGKLIRVVSGAIFDVAVDVRRSSSAFGKWVGVELSSDHHNMLWIPPGFAHGFLTLTEYADVVYRCTDFWNPKHERAIAWNDVDLGIPWPLAPHEEPLLSPKDASAKQFSEAEYFP